MAQVKAKKSFVGGSKLKTNTNNKLIILILVLVVALVGGFFVYRSFASTKRQVYTAADKEIRVMGPSAGSKPPFFSRFKDGTASAVLQMSAGGEYDSENYYRYTTSPRFVLTLPTPLRLATHPTTTPVCAYVAVVNKDGQSVTSQQINAADPGTNATIAITATMDYNGSISEFLTNSHGTGKNRDADIIGVNGYKGVGNYRKYCGTIPKPTNGESITQINVHSDWNDGKLNSLMSKGYKIRLLKIVMNDTAADAPFTKNPYQ